VELSKLKGKATIMALAILIITLPTILYIGYQSGLTQSATVVFEHPISDYSYIVWQDGNNYYAKNGETGAIDYSGTNASQIITNTVGSGGNVIYLAEGEYSMLLGSSSSGGISLLVSVLLPDNTKIRGAGMGKTILQLANNEASATVDYNAIFLSKNFFGSGLGFYSNIEISDITFDFNMANQPTPNNNVYHSNIVLARTYGYVLRNIEVKNAGTWGMALYGGDPAVPEGKVDGIVENIYAHHNGEANRVNFDSGIFVSMHIRQSIKLRNAYSYSNDGYGICLEDSPDSVNIEASDFYLNSFDGLYGMYGAWLDAVVNQTSGRLKISASNFYNNSERGIYLDSVGDDTEIIGCSAFFNGFDGITVYAHYRNITGVTLQSNHAYNNGQNASLSRSGIVFAGISANITHGMIANNMAYDTETSKTQDVGYSDNAYITNIIMIGNDWSGNVGTSSITTARYAILEHNYNP